ESEFASGPAAPARSCSVPGAPPLSWNVQANVALEPPAMSTAEGAEAVIAEAPPVAAIAGASGDGATPKAAASPELTTVMVAKKSCPRSMLPSPNGDSICKREIDKAAASCTAVLAPAEVEASAAPLFASVPAAAPVNESVPEPLPVSWKVQLKVALWPPASITGACNEVVDAEAPPVATTAGDAGEGRTCAAAASPVFLTTIETVNDWPRLATAGAVRAVIASAAGACTEARFVVAGAEATAASPSFLTSNVAAKVWPRLSDPGIWKAVTASAGGDCTAATGVDAGLEQLNCALTSSVPQAAPEKVSDPDAVPSSTKVYASV